MQETPGMQFDLATLRVDAQECGINGAILINASGRCVVEGQEHPVNFNHVFQIINDGTYYINNEIFRLALV